MTKNITIIKPSLQYDIDQRINNNMCLIQNIRHKANATQAKIGMKTKIVTKTKDVKRQHGYNTDGVIYRMKKCGI